MTHHIYFLSFPSHCDQGLIIVIVYYFQIGNKKHTTLLFVELLAVTWIQTKNEENECVKMKELWRVDNWKKGIFSAESRIYKCQGDDA